MSSNFFREEKEEEEERVYDIGSPVEKKFNVQQCVSST